MSFLARFIQRPALLPASLPASLPAEQYCLTEQIALPSISANQRQIGDGSSMNEIQHQRHTTVKRIGRFECLAIVARRCLLKIDHALLALE